MASPVARVRTAITEMRRRSPIVDHGVRMQEHYSRVRAGSLAGAVTYFAFLSFFPILALAFFVVGYVVRYFPHAQSNLLAGIEQVLPGMIGTGDGQITLQAVQDAAATVGVIGLISLVYSGLGWLSGMRTALQVVFELPQSRRPSFLLGKLRDLVTLVVVGSILLVSVTLSGVVTRFSTQLLDLLGLGHELSGVVEVAAVLVALVADTVLLFVLFTVLARPSVPHRSLWQGAFLGSVALEVLKQLSSILLAATHGSPAFQAFGIALILLVWINYFSRVVMYAAAWAQTAPGSGSPAAREQAGTIPSAPPPVLVPVPIGREGAARAHRATDLRVAFGAGAAAALAAVVAIRRLRRH